MAAKEGEMFKVNMEGEFLKSSWKRKMFKVNLSNFTLINQ